MITLFLLETFVVFAAFRGEPGDMPGPRFRCERARMDSCIEAHRGLQNAALNEIRIIDEKIRIIARDRGAVSDQEKSLIADTQSLEVTARMAEKEIETANKLDKNLEIFPDGPEPENIFLLGNGTKIWTELDRAKRFRRLEDLLRSSRAEVTQLQPTLRKLATQINNLDAEHGSLSNQKNALAATAIQHGNMYSSRCQQEHCPDL